MAIDGNTQNTMIDYYGLFASKWCIKSIIGDLIKIKIVKVSEISIICCTFASVLSLLTNS